MLILHAGAIDGQLFLWGEVPPQDAAPGAARPLGRKLTASAPRCLPFDAGLARLNGALTEAGSPLPDARSDPAESVSAWLPTVDGVPVPSSPLIAGAPAGAPAALVAWQITVLPLPPEQAVPLLCASVGKDTLAPGVVVGKTLAYWSAVLRFAGTLVARQRFLPDAAPAPDGARARWKPVLLGPDADRLAALARAMPPACRALRRNGDSPPQGPAATVLTAVLDALTDDLVRTALPPAPLAPAKQGRKKPVVSFDSVHDAWLYALRSPDAVLHGSAPEATRLAEQVEEWRRPIAVASASPFRLCFRLEEPPDEEDAAAPAPRQRAGADWYVRYLLQAADDPSLLVPAEDVWTARGRTQSLLQRGGFNPREYLLTTLGEVSTVSPPIEASLKTPAPAGYPLDATGAHEFLTEKAWILDQAGFGVLLPAWWTRKGTKLHLSVRANVKSPKMQGGSGMGLNVLVSFNWEVALGDQTLSRQELETLARLKAPLVKVRGQWVQLTAEEIAAALDFWKQKDTQQAAVRDVVKMALGAARAPGAIEFAGVSADGWVGDFLAQLEGRGALEELPAPAGFQGTLRPYQARGYSWLAFLRQWGLGACLADDMGLGKTVQTLALLRREWQPTGGKPTLLICPTSVVGNWQKEAARFTPELPVLVHHGLKRVKGQTFAQEARKQALVLSSYALLHRDRDLFAGVPWAAVILDEAQNIKNPETKQARAARSLPADSRIALTGTPVENHVGDLWSILEFLNPGFLGSQAAFKRAFFVPIQANRDPDALKRLKQLTGSFILRRLKTDKRIIADLPDKLEMKVFCTLTKEQASLYEAVVKDASEALDAADGIRWKGVVLATLSKLKQVCNHPAQFLGDNSAIPNRSGKLARLTEMLEEVLDVGDRALVFSQFSEMGAIIQRHLQETFGREVLFLHGAVSKKQRDALVERFEQGGTHGPRVFVLSLKAGGTGLNLTGANHVFHFDRWWNPAVENQATDRAFRIGQTRNVQVHKFLCLGTLEERIDEMIERKQAVAGSVVGTGEAWLTALSTAELKQLFALRQEAIAE
jgi:SNF2 family DNA or RNA helicase